MKNIIYFICSALLFWGCSANEEPNEGFSIKGTLVENCETGKPDVGVNMVLICRDYPGRGGKSDAIIPFKTNADGSFFVKGEPNYPYYFVTKGANQISSGVTFIEGLGPKSYNFGVINSFRNNEYHYPLIIKYDIKGSSFQEGDTLKTFNENFKLPVNDKLKLSDFSKPDTVFIKGSSLGTLHIPDSDYYKYLAKNGFLLTTSNFFYLSNLNKQNATRIKVNYAYNVVFTCDNYPVVTVKVP
ncbi:MAG: hypothetical protein ACOVMN_04900 [Flexibacteraceae bacterium]